MFRTRSRSLAAFAVGTILFAALAGCGSNDSPDAKKPSSEQTSAPDSKKAPDADEFVTALTDAMLAKRTAKLELELGSSMSASADVDYAASGIRMALKMITGSTTVRVVVADGAMYLQQTQGDKYLKIDKDDPALGSLLGQISSFGPQASLAGLKAGITKIDDRGTAKVDGENLTHYVLTVDTSKVENTFGAAAGSEGTPKTLTYDVYVDSSGLLRRVKMKIDGQSLVMKVSEWGKPVTITVPPASQVMTR